MSSMFNRQTWLAIALLAVAGSGCGPGYVVTSSHAMGEFTGRLVTGSAPPDLLDPCVFLEDASGRRVEVIYPSGWTEEFHPTRIVDPTGATFAREGDRVRVTFIADGIGASVCSSGMPVAAETIERVGSSIGPSEHSPTPGAS